ncbi:MAG: response regulator [Candidatus Aminicenantes bacterium]|nr:response regulator [Candidatus Aminicenantes bacterium]
MSNSERIDTRSSVLIIDDDPYMFNVLREFLDEAGYKVQVATRAETAFEVTGTNPPDIILLDINLPGTTGFVIASRLKAARATRDIPIIFMSVRTDAKDKVRAFTVGAVDYLTKPINLDEAAARINTHLTLRVLQKSLEEKNARLSREISERKKVETALRNSEEKIKISLREKEVLLKEVHHRVKNNLQIINSLLNLQSREVRDAKSLAVFEKCKNRIDTIALVHEKLYQSEDLANINFGEYVRTLTSRLFDAYATNLPAVELNIDADDLFLEVNKAIPCALVINELVTNSLKHAFPGGREGKVTVALKLQNSDKIALTVADNGVGLPGEFPVEKPETLGMQIINALVGQLHGFMQVDKSKGTKFTIEFRLKEKDTGSGLVKE